MNEIVRRLRRAALLNDGAGQTDGQLLGQFLDARDDAAFEALVKRHGPMVLGVCRRILRHEQDSEDAFQATFLVLVRKASAIVPREMVGNWLYGVAHQTAIRVRAMATRRKAREKQVAVFPDVTNRTQRDDLTPLLDQELSRLPEKYRAAIVLCDLEGRTRKEAAKQLGWPEGSVATRLLRGRAMLAKRLVRHGLVLSAEALAVSLLPSAASASLPPSLVSITVEAATAMAAGQTAAASLVSAQVASITQGVVMSLFLTKIKTLTVTALLVCLLGVGAGGSWLASQAPAEEAQATERQSGPQKKFKAPALMGKKASEKERIAELETRLQLVQAQFQADLAHIRLELELLRDEPKAGPAKIDANAETVMLSSPINAMELSSVLQSLFNVQGQPKVLRVAPVPSLSAVIVQGRPDDVRRVQGVIAQLEERARVLEEETKQRVQREPRTIRKKAP